MGALLLFLERLFLFLVFHDRHDPHSRALLLIWGHCLYLWGHCLYLWRLCLNLWRGAHLAAADDRAQGIDDRHRPPHLPPYPSTFSVPHTTLPCYRSVPHTTLSQYRSVPLSTAQYTPARGHTLSQFRLRQHCGIE
eukprot:3940680-Rhodomonas_salina.1